MKRLNLFCSLQFGVWSGRTGQVQRATDACSVRAGRQWAGCVAAEPRRALFSTSELCESAESAEDEQEAAEERLQRQRHLFIFYFRLVLLQRRDLSFALTEREEAEREKERRSERPVDYASFAPLNDDHAKRQRLFLAPARSVSRVPAFALHQNRRRVQVRAPAQQRRSPVERPRHRLLRQHQGEYLSQSARAPNTRS